MSLTVNAVHIAGHLTRDPETRTAGSTSVASFGVALNRTFKKADGTKSEETSFVDVEAWGKTGELVQQHLKRGSLILVEGRLKQDTWEKDGQKRSKLYVVADRVHFVDTGTKSDAPAAEAREPWE